MGGIIRPHRHMRCVCGGRYRAVVDPEYIYKVPRCVECGKPPRELKIKVTLPGGGSPKDIYFTGRGQRIRTLSQADGWLRDHHDDIERGTFKPELYTGKKKQLELSVGWQLQADYEWRKERLGQKGCSPKYVTGLKSMLKVARPYFDRIKIHEINTGHLEEFLECGASTPLQRARIIQWIFPVLKKAAKKYPSVQIPVRPELPQAEKVEEFMPREVQLEIASHATWFKEALQFGTMYPMRPCELRALQWGDIDFGNRTVTICRHFSGAVLDDHGRKSQGKGSRYRKVVLHLHDEALSLLRSLKRTSIEPNEFVFKTRTGNPIYESGMYRAWKRACNDAGYGHHPVYQSLKHSTAYYYVNREDVPIEDMRAICGHSSLASTERYAPKDSYLASQKLARGTNRVQALSGGK